MFGSSKKKLKLKAWAYIGCGRDTYLKEIVKWEYKENGVTILTCTNGTVIELNAATACMIEHVKEVD